MSKIENSKSVKESTKSQTKDLTGYEVSKIVNLQLKNLNILVVDKKSGLEKIKQIPTQMIYNYMKKNYIKTTPQNLITIVECDRFMTKYIGSQITITPTE